LPTLGRPTKATTGNMYQILQVVKAQTASKLSLLAVTL